MDIARLGRKIDMYEYVLIIDSTYKSLIGQLDFSQQAQHNTYFELLFSL